MKRWKIVLSSWSLLMLTWAQIPGLTEIPPLISVRLFEARPEIQTFKMSGSFQIIVPIMRALRGDAYLITHQNGKVVMLNAASKTPLVQASRILLRIPTGKRISLQPGRLPFRYYSGAIELSVDTKGRLKIVNQIPAQTYVTLVVGSETMPSWPTEALKAQAVLTQTRLTRYKLGDALGDSTQQEAYLGEAYHRPAVEKAVSAVWGETLHYEGRPIVPFYHASCGGHTSDGRFFSTKRPLPWLVAVPCPYCKKAPFAKETHTHIPHRIFDRAFPSPLPKVIRHDTAGRPLVLKLGNGKTMSGYDFWIQLGQKLGWDKAPGARFSLVRLNNGATQITSTGAGHGVGMCQWGAAEMARQGKTYQQILKFYFPKSNLVKLRS